MTKKFVTMVVAEKPDAFDIVARTNVRVAAGEIEIVKTSEEIKNPFKQRLLKGGVNGYLDWVERQLKGLDE